MIDELSPERRAQIANMDYSGNMNDAFIECVTRQIEQAEQAQMERDCAILCGGCDPARAQFSCYPAEVGESAWGWSTWHHRSKAPYGPDRSPCSASHLRDAYAEYKLKTARKTK